MTGEELQTRFEEALRLHQAGERRRAEALYREVLRHRPGYAPALHLLGVLQYQHGAPLQAVSLIKQAIQRNPRVASFHNNLGNALQQLGRVAEAEDAFRAALRLKRTYVGAAYNLARLLSATGRPEEAVPIYQAVLKQRPEMLEAVYALAAVLVDLDRLREAEGVYRTAIRHQPGVARLHLELANLLQQQGRLEEAMPAYKAVIERDPISTAAYNNLAACLQLVGRGREALPYLEEALRLEPDFAEGHFNRGSLLEEEGRFDEARVAYERALQLEPDFAAQVVYHLAFLKMKIADWEGYDERVDELLWRTERHLERGRTAPLPPLTLNVYPVPARVRASVVRHQVKQIRRATSEAARQHAFKHSRSTPDRLRIGYVSPDFRRHAVGSLIHDLFARHDREAFEVYAYALVEADDPFNQRIRAGVDHYVDISQLAPAEAARRIHADGIHVLVDLAGYTTFSRTALFALQPAPIQLHWLGYLDTMGANFLPYMIVDQRVLTVEMREHFNEALVVMPDAFVPVSTLPAAEVPSRAELGLPEEGFVFCCFNGLHKIEPGVFDVWMRILKRVPGSVLWLYDGGSPTGVANLRREAEARGVDPQRVVFTPRKPMPAYLAQYRVADLFLDTFLYNAGATAAGALWAGLPVLTCPQRTFFGRMGASLVETAGLPELVCDHPAQYEDYAVQIAQRPRVLQGLRKTLAEQRAEAPLFDVPRFVDHLELAYRAMWQRYADHLAPADIYVDDLVRARAAEEAAEDEEGETG